MPYNWLTDEGWYVVQAHRLFSTNMWTIILNYSQPTAQHGPLTSILMAPFAWLDPHAYAGLRNVMAVLGTVTVMMMGLTGRELGGERVGLIAAGVTAALPDFWIRDGLVVSEPVAALLVVTAVWVALRYGNRVTVRVAVAFGVLAGLVCLARTEIVLAVLVIAGVVIARRTTRRRALCAVAAVLSTVAVISPWWIYNEGRFADTVILSNNLGITLAGANCYRTYYDTSIMGYDSPACWNAAYARAAKQSSDESVQSKLMRDEAFTFVSHHLSRVPLVMVMREAWFLGLYRPGWVVHLGWLGGQPTWATWLQAASFWVLFPSAMAGWWLCRRRPWPHWLFGVLIVNSFVIAALFVGHWRYRITLDVGMVLIIALVVNDVWQRREEARAASSSDDVVAVHAT